MSRDATAAVGARPARRQQPRRVAAVGRQSHPLDQDPVRVQAARPLLARGGGGDRVAVGQAVIGERLRPGGDLCCRDNYSIQCHGYSKQIASFRLLKMTFFTLVEIGCVKNVARAGKAGKVTRRGSRNTPLLNFA